MYILRNAKGQSSEERRYEGNEDLIEGKVARKSRPKSY